MSDKADLEEAMERRTQAWARVNGDIGALRAGLAERPIAQRLKDHAEERMIDTIEQARTVARDNPLIIGGVIAALAGWFLRGPIVRKIQGWVAK